MMTRLILIFILMSTHSVASELSSVKWLQINDSNTLKIFKPIKYKHPSGLVPIRFITELNHPIEKVLTVLDDSNNKKNWMPSLKEIVDLEVYSPQKKTVYYRYHTPWPLRDRDFIIISSGKFNKDTNEVFVTVKSVQHNLDPKPSGVIRGIAYDGYSKIQMLGPNKTRVEMAFLNDFNGALPKFIINYVQKRWPHKFVQMLKDELRKNIIINPHFKTPTL